MIRVAVVDDQPLMVSAFAALIRAQPDMFVVGTGANGQEALRLCEHTAVDVLVMDVRMPVMDGIEATRLLVERAGTPNILILTTFNTDQLVLDAVAAGARGFLLKDAEPDIVLSGIRAIHRGEAVVSPQAAPALLDALRHERTNARGTAIDALTNREIEVLRLVGQGLTNAEIAAHLVIAQTTVKTHVGSLLAKLGARDRVALAILAHTVGLGGDPLSPR